MKQLTLLWAVCLLSLSLNAQIPNDICSNAEALPDWDVDNMTSAVMDGANATVSGVSPSCQTLPLDGWYSFVMPFDGNILVNGTGNCEMAIYDFDAGTCYAAEVYCASLNHNHALDLVGGQEYVVQVWRVVGTAGDIDFNLLATPLISNDDCNTAEALPDWDANDESSASFDTNGATSSGNDPSCGGLSRDGWYSFSMPYDGNILVSGTPNCRIAIYDADMGSCFGSEIYCGSLSTNHAYNLIGGQDYIVQGYRILGTDGVLSFTLSTSPIIANDECDEAIAFPDWDANNETSLSFDTNSATPSADTSPTCEIGQPRDAWFSFTMPFEGQLFLNGTANSEIVIYPADDINCFVNSEVYCGNLSTSHAYDLIADQDYIVRAYRALGTDGVMNMNLEAVPKIPNDECADATELIFDTDFISNNAFDTNGASPSPEPDPSCETNPRDGWYVFESPINGYYDIGGSANTEFAIYDACGGLELDCLVGGLDFAVTQGETYYIRAYRRLGTDGEMNVNLIPSVTKVALGTMGGCEALPSLVIDASNNAEWVNILDDIGNVVGSILANGQSLGEITANLEIDLDDVRLFGTAEQPYLRREVEISTEFPPTSPVDVRLYILQDEGQDLFSADDNLNNIFALEVNKKDVPGCSGGLVGDFVQIEPYGAGLYDEGDYFIEFQVSSFSTFYPGNVSAIVPIELSDFSGIFQGNHWDQIGTVAASGNSNSLKRYSYLDSDVLELSYYRLGMIDRDGSIEYSQVISILNDRNPKIAFFPNPTKQNLNVDSGVEIQRIELYSLAGKKLVDQTYNNDRSISLELANLDNGAYFIKVFTSVGIESHIIQKHE